MRWRAAVDWSRFELVVIRSPWDYQDDVDRFLDVLARSEPSLYFPFDPTSPERFARAAVDLIS